MDLMTILGVTVYFTVGWFLSQWLTKDDDKEEVSVFIFLFWPLLIVMLVGMLILAILMVIAVLVTKLMNPFSCERGESAKSNKGDKQDGAV